MWLCGTSTNLSKPEKDPKAIAAARNLPASNYPRYLLCAENEGCADRVNHPARQNHRVVPITINGSPWFLQYSPYVYYNEHCICFNREHIPMKIDRACFGKLLDFVGQFPTTSWAPTPTCPSWAAPSWPTTTSRAGGTPTARDRETVSRMGYEAVNALLADKGNRIIGTRDGQVTDMDMEEALAMVKNLEMYRYEVLEALTAKGKIEIVQSVTIVKLVS